MILGRKKSREGEKEGTKGGNKERREGKRKLLENSKAGFIVSFKPKEKRVGEDVLQWPLCGGVCQE